VLRSGSVTELHVAEFFAGIGLARLGLEAAGAEVLWANDISAKKSAMYRTHFGEEDTEHSFHLGDLGDVRSEDMPSHIDLAWASFPCTDLSLAGTRGGLRGSSSSAFWHFIKRISGMGISRPKVIAIENVTAFVSSRTGRDIRFAIKALNGLGYSVDLLSMDARRFVPQSRPRLFMIAMLEPPQSAAVESPLRPKFLQHLFDDEELLTHQGFVPEPPPLLRAGLTALADDIPATDDRWWSESKVLKFTESLSELQLSRLQSLKSEDATVFRTAYRRMRSGVARWEMRPDDIAGCLRTASGGSSRQAMVRVGGGEVRIRWMTTTEYAKLMGAQGYVMNGVSQQDAYFGFGDAVCVPVVKWLTENYLIPYSSSCNVQSLSEWDGLNAASA
jgi:DNA (cytosine-5)-methyltransferase 1